MVVLGAGAVLTGGALVAAAPAAGAGAAAGTVGATSAVTAASGATAAAGTAAATATAAGGATAAASGSLAAAGASTSGAVAVSVSIGPIGWLALGTDTSSGDGITWNCWKDVLHDYDCNDSSEGILLRTIAEDSRIKTVNIEKGKQENFPQIILVNIWNESFHLIPVALPDGQIALHAEKI